jgi:hypothetical protein
LSLWTTISGRKRTARGNLAMARLTLSLSTRSTTPLRAVGMEVHIGMEATLTKAMVATSMATGTMEDTGKQLQWSPQWEQWTPQWRK